MLCSANSDTSPGSLLSSCDTTSIGTSLLENSDNTNHFLKHGGSILYISPCNMTICPHDCLLSQYRHFEKPKITPSTQATLHVSLWPSSDPTIACGACKTRLASHAKLWNRSMLGNSKQGTAPVHPFWYRYSSSMGSIGTQSLPVYMGFKTQTTETRGLKHGTSIHISPSLCGLKIYMLRNHTSSRVLRNRLCRTLQFYTTLKP